VTDITCALGGTKGKLLIRESMFGKSDSATAVCMKEISKDKRGVNISCPTTRHGSEGAYVALKMMHDEIRPDAAEFRIGE